MWSRVCPDCAMSGVIDTAAIFADKKKVDVVTVPDVYLLTTDGTEDNFDKMLDGKTGRFVDWGVVRVPRRAACQKTYTGIMKNDAVPMLRSDVRNGLEKPENITFTDVEGTVPYTGQSFNTVMDVDLHQNMTYAIGPSPVPFHFNAASGPGLQGVVNGVAIPSYSAQAAQDAWWDDPSKKLLLSPVTHDVIRLSYDDRIAWADRSKKKPLYLAVIDRLEYGDGKIEFVTKLQSKTNDALLKSKERVIAANPTEVTVLTAPEVEIGMERLKDEWSLDRFSDPYVVEGIPAVPIVGCGLSAEQKGAFISLANEMAETSCANMCAGDDQAGLIKHQGKRFYIEGDAKQWDHSQGSGPIRKEHAYARKLGMSNETLDMIWKCNTGMLAAKNPERYSTSIVSAELKQSVMIDLAKLELHFSIQ